MSATERGSRPFEAVGAHETVFPWTVDPTSVCAFSAVGMRCLKAQQPVP